MTINVNDIKEILKGIDADPVWGVETLFDCSVWGKQKEIIESVLLHKNKITSVRSCHDSGKSFVSAKIALLYLLINPDSIVVTTAPSWTQVKEILWREMRGSYASLMNSEVFANSMFSERKMLDTRFEIDDNWFAIGLATRKEGDATDVAERLLGFHSKTGKILILADEGSGILEPVWGAIDGLLTSEYSQLLTTGNPYRKVGTFAMMFKRKGVNKIHIQDTDIPNIEHNKIIIPGLMSPKYPQEMADKYGKDSNVYLVKVKGEFPSSESDTLISLDDLEKAFERIVEKPEGQKILGVDVARFGGDRTVFLVRQGFKILRKEIIYKSDLMIVVGHAKKIMDEEGIIDVNVKVDEIGVGAGVVDRFHEDDIKVSGVNVGKAADDTERFINIRAEIYWDMRNWIKNADIPRDDDYLEIANLKYKLTSKGKGQTKIESKEEMKKRGLSSPDVADALMLTFADGEHSDFDLPNKDDLQENKPETAGLLDEIF